MIRHLLRCLSPDPGHNQPTVGRMRYPVEFLLDLLAAGMTPAEILSDSPALEEDDLRACLAYAV